MALIIGWLVFSFLVGWMCENKSIGFWGGFFLSLLLSPLIGFIIALFIPDKQQPVQYTISNATKTDKIADLHDRLEKLEAMKEKALISDDEYNKLRSEIMAGK